MTIRISYTTLTILALSFGITTKSWSQCAAVAGTLGGPVGDLCLNSAVNIGIPETKPDQTYTWYRNGTAVHGPKQGDGSSVSLQFAMRTMEQTGDYKILTQKAGCAPVEFGNVNVTTTGPAPQKLYGGTKCSSGDYVFLKLSGTQIGVSYSLYGDNGTTLLQGPIAGTGGPYNFSSSLTYSQDDYVVKATGLGCTDAWVATYSVTETLKADFTESLDGYLTSCWTKNFVVGSSNYSMVNSSTSPATVPHEGTGFLSWPSSTIPAGNQTRFVTPEISLPYPPTVDDPFPTAMDVEFYFYNNNNPAKSTGAFLNDGVQFEYFDGMAWVAIGPFIQRHDPTLAPNTGQWKKKTITLPYSIVNIMWPGKFALRFSSGGGDNCAIDALTFKHTPGCFTPNGLNLLALTATSATLGWNIIAGNLGFEYAVVQSGGEPASGTFTTGTTATVNSLLPGTQYTLYVRSQSPIGFTSWKSFLFYTPRNCAIAPLISPCTDFTVNVEGGEGMWNFFRPYPSNGVGVNTHGKEALVRFTPTETGLYYLNGVSHNAAVRALYKPASLGCVDTGWIAIMMMDNNRGGVGILQSGVEYYFVFDHLDQYAGSWSGTYKICKAIVGPPSVYNGCINISTSQLIPAGNTKKEYFFDNNGSLIASVDMSKTFNPSPGISLSYFVRSGTVRRDLNNVEYFDRNYNIRFGVSNNDSIKAAFYFPNSELQRLVDEPDDGIGDVATLQDLYVTYNTSHSSCETTVTGNTNNIIPASMSGVWDANSSYVEANISKASDYKFDIFLHAGIRPLNYSCPAQAQYTSLPFYQNFNTNGPAILPFCWTETPNNSSVSFRDITPSIASIDGSRYLFYNSYAFPAGTSTTLTTNAISTMAEPNVDLEFYWHNNHNPSYTDPTEGVRIEYSINGTVWTLLNFFARHDASLAPNTSQWKRKKIALPAAAGNRPALYIRFIFQSQYGDDCAMENVVVKRRVACDEVATVTTNTITASSVSFSWTAVAGITSYNVAATTSVLPPAFGWTTVSGTSTTLSALQDLTSYYLHVRPVCPGGLDGGWTTIVFTTSLNCTSVPALSAYTNVTAVMPAGTGVWNLSGTYPNNSIGYNTPGKEKLYTFTPSSSGIYVLEVVDATGYFVDYFYKPSLNNCVNTGWIGIYDFLTPGIRPIGLLQEGQKYDILLDPETTEGSTQTFRIWKTFSSPSSSGVCSPSIITQKPIPANSSKEEYILNANGTLVAALDFSNVNTITQGLTASTYLHYNPGMAARRTTGNKEYLDRNLTITSPNPLSGTLGLRIYMSGDELQRLVDEPNDGIADVTDISELHATRVQQFCSNAPTEAASSILPQVSSDGGFFSDKFIKVNTSSLGTFFMHGGLVPLNQPAGTARICPGGSINFAMASAGAGYTYQWQVNTGSGFTNISNGAVYSGATTNNLQLINPPTNWYGYQYRCVATGASPVTSAPVVLKFAAVWNGFQDNAWESPGNWNCGALPDENTDVIIPQSFNSLPVINSNRMVRSLEARTGVTITVNSGFQLQIRN